MSDPGFWDKWTKADEVERLKLVRTLSPFTHGGVCQHMTATLMNSYLVDLYNFMWKEEPFEKRPLAKALERPLCARCGKKPAMKTFDICFSCFLNRKDEHE